MMIELFEKIQDSTLKSFTYRAWNTFKSIILPIALPIIYADLQSTPDDISGILHGHLWMKVVYAVLIALVGSAIAGLDKVNRLKK